jgi:hypothetical protein
MTASQEPLVASSNCTQAYVIIISSSSSSSSSQVSQVSHNQACSSIRQTCISRVCRMRRRRCHHPA